MKKYIILTIIFSALLSAGICYGFLTYFEIIDMTMNPICPETIYYGK